MLRHSSMTGEDMKMKKMTEEKNDLPVPVIIKPFEGEKVGRRPLISGTAERAGDIVEVYKVAGTRLLQVTVAADGLWSGALENLATGQHTITAKLVRGNQSSAWSPQRSFTVE